MLIDANLLLYAVNSEAKLHELTMTWLTERLNGDIPIAIPWESLVAFVRISTDARVFPAALAPSDAWSVVAAWLDAPAAWIPLPTERHASILGALIAKYEIRGKLIPDAHLAALAIEHGLEVASADTDFARFSEITWRNPLAG